MTEESVVRSRAEKEYLLWWYQMEDTHQSIFVGYLYTVLMMAVWMT